MAKLPSNFCCVMYGHNLGETFAKDLADKIKERFQIDKVKIGWETITKDVFDTMVDNMKESVYAFFVYTKDMKRNYARWFEDATKLARTLKNKHEVMFVTIKPYTVKMLHEENENMAIFSPVEFDGNYMANHDKWQAILQSMENKANAWKLQHKVAMNQDPRERNQRDRWRSFLQNQWEVIIGSAYLVNMEDTLIASRVVDMEMVEEIKAERLIKRREMTKILEHVMRAQTADEIKTFFRVLQQKEVTTFNLVMNNMNEELKCDYFGKPYVAPKKMVPAHTSNVAPHVPAAAPQVATVAPQVVPASPPIESVRYPVQESGGSEEPMDISDSVGTAPVTSTSRHTLPCKASRTGQTAVKQRVSGDSGTPVLKHCCHKCGVQYSRQTSNFCQKCGEKRLCVRPCWRCKEDVMADENFCPECGAKQT